MSSILHYTAFGLLILNLGSFFWSVFGVFVKYPDFDQIKYRILQINSLALYFACAIAAFNNSISLKLNLAYSVTLLLCLIFFWINSNQVKKYRFSIIFSNDIPNSILKSGLYRFVRHPFYIIYMIVYISTAFFTADLWVFILSTTIFYLYYKAARKEENKFLSSDLKTEYDNYLKKTGMFFPKLFYRKSS